MSSGTNADGRPIGTITSTTETADGNFFGLAFLRCKSKGAQVLSIRLLSRQQMHPCDSSPATLVVPDQTERVWVCAGALEGSARGSRRRTGTYRGGAFPSSCLRRRRGCCTGVCSAAVWQPSSAASGVGCWLALCCRMSPLVLQWLHATPCVSRSLDGSGSGPDAAKAERLAALQKRLAEWQAQQS